jgi:hypothetical protein
MVMLSESSAIDDCQHLKIPLGESTLHWIEFMVPIGGKRVNQLHTFPRCTARWKHNTIPAMTPGTERHRGDRCQEHG